MTDKKRKFLLENIKLDAKLVEIIDQLCSENLLGSDKYAVWIGKEAKKDESILEFEKLRNIIDWAQSTRPNILAMNFEKALLESNKFHEELKNKVTSYKIVEEKIDPKRIIYKCKDGKHFFYSIVSKELKREGNLMGHCVGTNKIYAKKLKKGLLKIVSLRDDKNLPHVTCEIHTTGTYGISGQVSGKGNDPPIAKYLNFITEFSIWAAGDLFTVEEKEQLNDLTKLYK